MEGQTSSTGRWLWPAFTEHVVVLGIVQRAIIILFIFLQNPVKRYHCDPYVTAEKTEAQRLEVVGQALEPLFVRLQFPTAYENPPWSQPVQISLRERNLLSFQPVHC